MTIIKTKIVKEVINNIEQEQQENKLNWEQKTDDWKEKYIFRCEQLEELKKDLKDKNDKIEFLKDYEKDIREANLNVLKKYRKEIRILEARDENKQISLLKEQHEEEIRELKNKERMMDDNYDYLNKENLKTLEEVDELKKELEEKELLVESLEEENDELRLGLEANLDAIKLQENWEKRKQEKLKEELNSKGETLLQFIGMLAREKVQNEKLQTTITEREENLKEINEKLARVTQKNEELEKQLCKKRIRFGKLGLKTKAKVRQMAEKAKFRVQELVARIEVKTK